MMVKKNQSEVRLIEKKLRKPCKKKILFCLSYNRASLKLVTARITCIIYELRKRNIKICTATDVCKLLNLCVENLMLKQLRKPHK